MNQHRFYYQPEPIISTIDWCWTFVVLLTGIIFWLEVTHFQWISMCFFVAFFIISGAELLDRKLIIQNHVLIVKDMFARQWQSFNLQNATVQLSFTRHMITIKDHGRRYKFSLLPKGLRQLQQLVKENHK